MSTNELQLMKLPVRDDPTWMWLLFHTDAFNHTNMFKF